MIASAHKLFCIAETVIANYPAIRKVIILKRTPRYDKVESDPLSLKPQLSSLADSASFGVWCDSKFKDRIILGGQDIPSGDIDHSDVFGNPSDQTYDGIHMRGPHGRSFLTRSVQKVLMKAQLIVKNDILYGHQGWKNSAAADPPHTNNPAHTRRVESQQIERHPSTRYNAMGLMIRRIRSLSSAHQNGKANHIVNDEVFSVPSGRNEAKKNAVHKPERNPRPSVIKTSPACLQSCYSVPVSNLFETLGN